MTNKQLKKWRKTGSRKNPVISVFSRLMEEYRDYDKSAFYLPRQVTKIVLKTFENQGIF